MIHGLQFGILQDTLGPRKTVLSHNEISLLTKRSYNITKLYCLGIVNSKISASRDREVSHALPKKDRSRSLFISQCQHVGCSSIEVILYFE